MANAIVFDSVPTNPGGTGSTITVTLPTHAVGDIIYIEIGNTGNTLWTGNPAGWNRAAQVNVGTASNGLIGTFFWRRVVSGDSLPLSNPVFTLGATVSRIAFAKTWRGADLEGPFTLPEWVRAYNTGTSNPVRPTSVTTPAPESLVNHGYFSRTATNAPDPSGYTQDEEAVISGTLVGNSSSKVNANQGTVLSNQDASPTSGVRWVAGIVCVPSPDYVYYRSGTAALNANGLNATPNLPTGTSSNDNAGRKDLIIATVACAGTPTIAPNTLAHWTQIAGEWDSSTSGNGTKVTKWRTHYTGTLDRQFNRSTSGEIYVYLSVYRNTDQTAPIGAFETQQNASSTTGTFPSMVRTETKSTVQITCIADGTPTYTAPAGFTERNDGNGTTCADQIFNAGSTVNSASFTLSTTSPTLAGQLEILSHTGSALPVDLVVQNGAHAHSADNLALTQTHSLAVQNASHAQTAESLTLTTFGEFPVTAVLDSFNRGDEGPPPSGNWTTAWRPSTTGFKVVGNAAVQDNPSNDNSTYWNVVNFGPDVEVYGTLSGGASDYVGLAARLVGEGTSGVDGYEIVAFGGNSIQLVRWDNNSQTNLGAAFSQAISNGDSFGMSIIGSTLTAYYKPAAGNWTALGTRTDSTYSAAGKIGMRAGTGTVDDFGGGTVGADVSLITQYRGTHRGVFSRVFSGVN